MLAGKHIGLSSEEAEKQSILCGQACMDSARIREQTMGTEERNWGPDNLDDQNMLEQLETFEDPKATENVIPSHVVPGWSVISHFNAGGTAKPIFRSCLEPWETVSCHRKNMWTSAGCCKSTKDFAMFVQRPTWHTVSLPIFVGSTKNPQKMGCNVGAKGETVLHRKCPQLHARFSR